MEEDKDKCSCDTCTGDIDRREKPSCYSPECEGCQENVEIRKYLIEGMDCADCAQKLEQRVRSIEGVHSARFNLATSTLEVDHDISDPDIINIIESSGYRVVNDSCIAEFDIEGLDCADCAVKFEKAISQVPGVLRSKVDFNLAKLTVEYTCDKQDIIDTASKAGYNINEIGTIKKSEFLSKHRHGIVTVLSGALVVSGFIASFLNYRDISVLLYFMAVVIGGFYFARSALYSIKTLTPDMNLLMAIAVIGAMFIGQWEEAATVTFLFSLGNALQSYTLDKTRNSIKELIKLSPKEATIKKGDAEIRIKTALIRIGDIMVVKPGEMISMDGVAINGSSYVNEASITGEPMPVQKNPGNEVFAGTMNEKGALEVRVTRLAEDNTINKIIHMVEEAQANKAPAQEFIDRFSRYYTPAVIFFALMIAVLPVLLFSEPFYPWLYRALVLLVISCPCALVISTPVSIIAAIGNASKKGVLVKGGIYLEEIGRTDVVAFDKTGTLTYGKPSVSDVLIFGQHTREEAMGIASALESRSEHPLATAILKDGHNGNSGVKSLAEFESIPGKGVRGIIDGKEYFIGSLKLFENMKVSDEAIAAVEALQKEGKTPVALGTKDGIMAVISIFDELRPESRQVVSSLHRSGVKEVLMITGDNEKTARAISEMIGLDGYYAGLLPADKASLIDKLKEKFGKVVMVGDGVNDAPALAKSNVGIAMGATGSDTALETADIALMSNDISKLEFIIKLGQKTLSIIKENIAFAIFIKALFIILAISGLANLWMAVFADMGASLIVILNGMRLLRVR